MANVTSYRDTHTSIFSKTVINVTSYRDTHTSIFSKTVINVCSDVITVQTTSWLCGYCVETIKLYLIRYLQTGIASFLSRQVTSKQITSHHVYVCVFMYACLCLRVYVCVSMYACLCRRVYVCMCMCVMYACVRVYVGVRVCAGAGVYVCMCACACELAFPCEFGRACR